MVEYEFFFELDDSESENENGVIPRPEFAQSGLPMELQMDDAPIVVLVGPIQCGKSMVLARLCNYLRDQRYSISPDFYFDYLGRYYGHDYVRRMCDGRISMPETVDPYMIRVSDIGKGSRCHIVDASGMPYDVQYGKEAEKSRKFHFPPPYLDAIAASKRKVIYIIFLDYGDDDFLRDAYISRMRRLYDRYIINTDSRVILLQNKVDLFRDGRCANARGVFDKRALRDYAYQRYEDLFFKKKYFWGERITVDYVPFCTGTYSFDDNFDIYIPSDSSYPQMLWKTIKKAL